MKNIVRIAESESAVLAVLCIFTFSLFFTFCGKPDMQDAIICNLIDNCQLVCSADGKDCYKSND